MIKKENPRKRNKTLISPADVAPGKPPTKSPAEFLEAYKIHNFDISRACRAIGLAPVNVDNWRHDSPDFCRQMAQCEIDFHVKLNKITDAIIDDVAHSYFDAKKDILSLRDEPALKLNPEDTKDERIAKLMKQRAIISTYDTQIGRAIDAAKHVGKFSRHNQNWLNRNPDVIVQVGFNDLFKQIQAPERVEIIKHDEIDNNESENDGESSIETYVPER